MNILYLCDEYPPGRHGGIGTCVQLLAREMVKRGHNVVVAGFYDWGYGQADEEEDMGVKVYRFRRKLNATFFQKRDSIQVRLAYRLLKMTRVFQWDIKKGLKQYHIFLEDLIQRYNIDIVEMPDFNEYIHFCHSEVYFPRLSVPVVVKLHGSISYFLREAGKSVPPVVLNMEGRILQQATAVVSVSKYTAEKTAEYLDYPGPITPLYNGIKPMDIPEVEKIPGRVIFTGTLVEKKGICQLMRAWNKVHESIPDAQLFVFGKGNIDKLKAFLSDEAFSSVHFKGHVKLDELFLQLAASELAVFPSFAEAFALAPMEAMACGTAVLYSTYTSGPELISHGVNGWLADPADVESIADSIIYLLKHTDIRNELAQKGKDLVRDSFSISKIAEQHERFYEEKLKKDN